MAELRTIPLNKLRIPDVRASSRLTPEQREFFQATVEEFGVIQDPLVRPLPDGTFELIAGRTRILELAERGAREIQAKVIEADEDTAIFMHLAENVARGSVEPISVAKVITKLTDLGISVPDIARKLGRSETWVRRTRQLLELPEEYQEHVAGGRLTPTHVQIGLAMPTPYEVDEALQTAVRLGWNTPTLKLYVENRLEELRQAREESLAKGVEIAPPPPGRADLVQYKQCLSCGFRVPKEEIQVILICEDCRNLVKYVIDQVGPPKGAIQTVYSALTEYFKATQKAPGAPAPERGAPST